MTKDEIIKLAHQHGLCSASGIIEKEFADDYNIEAFARACFDIEREACAKVCDTEWNGDADTYEYAEACNECADAIRARGA